MADHPIANHDHEQAIIGALLTAAPPDQNHMLDRLETKDFDNPDNRLMFDAIRISGEIRDSADEPVTISMAATALRSEQLSPSRDPAEFNERAMQLEQLMVELQQHAPVRSLKLLDANVDALQGLTQRRELYDAVAEHVPPDLMVTLAQPLRQGQQSMALEQRRQLSDDLNIDERVLAKAEKAGIIQTSPAGPSMPRNEPGTIIGSSDAKTLFIVEDGTDYLRLAAIAEAKNRPTPAVVVSQGGADSLLASEEARQALRKADRVIIPSDVEEANRVAERVRALREGSSSSTQVWKPAHGNSIKDYQELVANRSLTAAQRQRPSEQLQSQQSQQPQQQQRPHVPRLA